MLSTIRNKATSLISYILIGAICLSFALWGINSYFEGAAQVDVASVNGDEITYDYYQNQLRARQQQMRQMFQNNLPEGYFETPAFKRQTVEQMVNEVLLNQIIEDRRYTLNDGDLAIRIKANQAFHTDGEFDDERYRRLLASNNWTVQTFENSQRSQGAFDLIEQALSSSYQIDDQELNDILKLQKQKRYAEYFIVETNKFEPRITDEEIQKQYEDFADLYKTQEQMKIDYVELSAEQLVDEQPLEDDEIATYFEENKTGFSKPEVRKASHILIKPVDDSAEADQKALRRAADILENINAGEDFAELAKQNSDDKGSANNGGDLGIITPGVMVKPFEEAVFALQQDQISDPVKSEFGYHIIKLTEFTPEQIPPLEELKTEIEEKIKNDRAVELFVEQAETFKNLVFESPESLQPIADELGLEIEESDWFTRSNGAGVANDANVRNMAFSDVVLQDNLNGDAVEVGENKLIALRKNDYKPSEAKPLDQVKSQIEILLKGRKAKEMADQKGEELLAQLKDGSLKLEDMVKAQEYSLIDLAETRDGAQAGSEQTISQAVFEQPRPKDNEPVFGGVSLGEGYAVYRLTKVEDINDTALEKIAEQDRAALASNMEHRFGSETANSILASLREQADIQIFEENL